MNINDTTAQVTRTAAKIADMGVGQFVIIPTTASGTWNGLVVAITPVPGQYATPGETDVTLELDNGTLETVRTSTNYTGYVEGSTADATPTTRAYTTRALWMGSNKVEKFHVETPTVFGRNFAARRTARSIASMLNDDAGRTIFYVRPTAEGASVYGARNTLAVLVTATEA